MLFQTVLVAAAIAYILCVLLISGVQKEDLSDATLRKLRRHNVNIDELNNEEKRQACAASNINTEKIEKLSTTSPVKFAIELSTTPLDLQTAATKHEPSSTLSKDLNKFEVEDMSKMETISKFWNVISKNLWKILPPIHEQQSNKEQQVIVNATKPSIEVPQKNIKRFDIGDRDIETISNFRTFIDEPKHDKNNLNIKDQHLMRQNYQVDETSEDNSRTTTIIKEQRSLNANNTNINSDIGSNTKSDILEIANQVKILLLKDLKQEMPSYAGLTIAPTKETPTTNPLDQTINGVEAKIVMDRFLKLCRHLNLKQTTITPILAREQRLKMQSEQVYPFERDPVNNGRGNFVQSMPLIDMPKEIQTNTFLPVKQKPSQIINKINPNTYSVNRDFKIIPKTIQTNSGEIPPLAIPINVKGKPGSFMKLIENQNIVIKTKTPTQIINHKEKIKDEEFSKQRVENFDPIPNIRVIQDKEKMELRTDSKINRKPFATLNIFEDSTTEISTHIRKVKTHATKKINKDFINTDILYDKSMMRSIERLRNYEPNEPRNQGETSIESIKEIIEQNKQIESNHGEIDSFENRKDSDESKISQRPLAPINKRVSIAKFDDTHFNNFLKTQQKVNDMLERILSSKSKRLLSIETV